MGASIRHPALESYTLSHDEMTLLLPENHPLAGQESIRLKDLRHEPFANVSNPGAADESIQNLTDLEYFCKKAGFSPRIQYWCDISYEVIETVRNSGCLAILPKRVLQGYNTAGILAKPISEPVCYSYLRLYTLKDIVPRRAVRQVIDSIKNYFAA